MSDAVQRFVQHCQEHRRDVIGLGDVDALKAYMERVDGGINTLHLDMQSAHKISHTISLVTYLQWVKFAQKWKEFFVLAYPTDWFFAEEDTWRQTEAYENDLKGWRKKYEQESNEKAAPYSPLPDSEKGAGSGPLIDLGGSGVPTVALFLGVGITLAVLLVRPKGT